MSSFIVTSNSMILAILTLLSQSHGQNETGPVLTVPPLITIGAVLGEQTTIDKLVETVAKVNSDGLLPKGLMLNTSAMILDENPIRAALDICNNIIKRQIYVMIVSHSHDTEMSPLSVSYTCGFYHIPVLGIAARDSVFSDKEVHQSFMRTVPPYSHQAELWMAVLQRYQWSKVIFITSLNQEGRTILSRFRTLVGANKLEIQKVVSYKPGQINFTEDLKDLPEYQSRVILMFAKEDDAHAIYRDAVSLNLTDAGWVWIVTEQALRPSNTPRGVLGFQLQHGHDEIKHIQDVVAVIVSALNAMQGQVNVTEAPKECTTKPDTWESGKIIKRYLQNVVLKDGLTGVVRFDEFGDRLDPMYELAFVGADGPTAVGVFGSDQLLTISDDSSIQWPGGHEGIPKGLKIQSHLKIVTVREEPFIYVRNLELGDSCNTGPAFKESREVECPYTDPKTRETKMYCCKGYCMDVLFKLAESVNFTYDVHLVEDGMYGTLENRDNSTEKEWNGMMGELLRKEADMIVAPMAITPERAEYVKFSKPFKYQGIQILTKRTKKDSSLGSFLQPFQGTLWILVLLSVHVVALVLYLLDRFSPFGHFKLAKQDDTEEDALNLSTAIWFAWGVLLNSGIGEGTPRSFSARVLGMVWAGFAMIIIASYTANLAAFLVLDREKASISGIDDPRLRNPTEDFKFATVKGSSVQQYFKRRVELSTMYRTMEQMNYTTPDEAIQDVAVGKDLHAFIWDSSRLEYEASRNCTFVVAGERFGREGLGLAMAKDNPWMERITLRILSLHETGLMENLDRKWILNKGVDCPKVSSPATLGLTNMAGVFMLVAGGIMAGIIIIFIEIVYHRRQTGKQKEMELARHAADRWRGNIEKKKVLKKSWEYLRDAKEDRDRHREEKRRLQRGNLLAQQQLQGNGSIQQGRAEAGGAACAPDTAVSLTRPDNNGVQGQSAEYKPNLDLNSNGAQNTQM